MRTLTDHIRAQGTAAEAETAAGVFAGLGLPLPYENEITAGYDGTLLFLNHPACVLRIQDEGSDRLAAHPHILQPLGRRQRGGLVFDINPGIPCPVRGRDVKRLRAALHKDNFSFWDDQPMNCGYLPEVAGLIGKHAFPVLLDPGAVEKLHSAAEEVAALLGDPGLLQRAPQPPAQEGPQEALYRPLRAAFDAAWPEDKEYADPARMKNFWNTCAAFRKEGKLVASWLGWQWKCAAFGLGRTPGNYKNVKGGALYARRWPQP